MRTLTTIVLFVSLLVVSAPAAAQPPVGHDIETIIRTIDKLYRSESSRAVIEMEIVTPHWQRTLSMEAWSLGLDKMFVRINSPRKEKGMGTLRIEREMWNYLPKVNKVIKIPPSMMASSWMGSDFTNDDIVQEITLVDDYVCEFATVENPEEGMIYIKATPHEDVPVVWGWYIMAITADQYVPVWEHYYDEHGRRMRTMRFSEPKEFGKRTIPTVLEVIPENKEGNRTIVRYLELEFDLAVDDDVFTLRNLRSAR